MAANILRGEIWLANFDPTMGREQAGLRPCLVVSDDRFNQSRAELVIVVPLTSKSKGVPSHVAITPPEGGLLVNSYAKCEDIRSISTARLRRRLGQVKAETMVEVEEKFVFCCACEIYTRQSYASGSFLPLRPSLR